MGAAVRPPDVQLPQASPAIREFAMPVSGRDIVAGPDGALWYTAGEHGAIVRVTVGGSATEFRLPAPSFPSGITAGPDGALWFTDGGANKIGRITTSGVVEELDLAGLIPQEVDGDVPTR